MNEEQSNTSVPKISLTKQVTDQEVDTPDIYISDPINVNPNSIANIEKFLLHIEKISGIKNRTRKWVVVTCDGVPYCFSTKLKEKFPWAIDLKRYAICQGYQTKNQLSYFKKCADHHKSWDSICSIYHQAMAMELLWPYVKSHPIPSVDGYLAWVKEQQDSLYLIKYEQTFVYLQAIINYRKAIRMNNPILKKAARRVFSPVWSARHHPIYHLIEAANEVQLMKLHPEIHNIIEKTCIVSRSGHSEQHQGLDAIIEEVNKALKSLIPLVPQDHHWKIALRKNLFKVIGYNEDQLLGPRTRPESTMECQRFQTLLRNFEFVNLLNSKPVCQSLDGEYELNEDLINFTPLAKQARQSFIIDTFINKGILLLFRLIPVTKQEAEAQKNEENMTIPEIVVKIETLFEPFGESTQKKYLG
ncbi:hypothetical protein F8M41_023090 [Gigaspora margarita]|uniref:Uncharacterized protein n=1 Tax=Gigaspora margarita TaxID=4874 RepID=A0A8H4EHP5_GIGMA|nr:hypothetical protein F8M41_023090 [Gigaspora margarita]